MDAGWSSPVAREAHNLEVAGSNPVPATYVKVASEYLKWPFFVSRILITCNQDILETTIKSKYFDKKKAPHYCEAFKVIAKLNYLQPPVEAPGPPTPPKV